MKVTEETITPKKAQDILDKHWVKDRQRTPSPAVVSGYARAMAAGQWMLTHQGIAIDDAGELVDGVHRLLAIVESRTPVRMLMTRGIAHNGVNGAGGMYAIDAIDRGRVRGVGQQLQLRHGISNGNVVAAAARSVLLLAVRSIAVGATPAVTVGDTLRVLDVYGAELQHCVSNRANVSGLRVGAAVGAFAFAMRPCPNEIKEAYGQFVTGEQLTRGNPMLTLRNWFLGDSRARGGGSFDTRIARPVLQAAQKHVLKESLLAIKPQSEAAYSFFLEKQRQSVKKLLAACGYE